MKLPEMYHLPDLHWQFFGTFTFREARLREGKDSSEQKRVAMFNAWGRELYWHYFHHGREWDFRSIYARRLEAGEIGGAFHFHFLMSGFDRRNVHRNFCEHAKAIWTSAKIGGGHCDVRVYDRSLNGAGYIAKCIDPGDRYEFNKFGLAQTITLSPGARSVLRVAALRAGQQAAEVASTFSKSEKNNPLQSLNPVGAFANS